MKSTSNKAYLSLGDDDTTGYIGAENGYLSLGAQAGVHSNNINYHIGNQTVSIGNATSTERLSVTGNIKASVGIITNHITASGTISASGKAFFSDDLQVNNDSNSALLSSDFTFI